MMQMYNQQGITDNYPQYTTNFWEDAGNNYGFGSSNISDAISHHPAMHTTPMPIEQTSNLPEINAFNDSYGGYSGVGNTAFEEQPISKASSSVGFQAPKTSMSDVFLEGVKGFGEGMENGVLRGLNSATFGIYDLANYKLLGNEYANKQNEQQDIAEQAGLGVYNKIANNLIDVGTGGKVTKKMLKSLWKYMK